MKYKTKYRRFGILLALILLIPFSGKAQSAQQAQELLDAVAEKVSSYEDIEIDFTWNLVNQKEQVDQKTQGSVMLKGERYRLSMMGMTRVFDGDKLFTIAPEDLELTVSDLDPEQDKVSPLQSCLPFIKRDTPMLGTSSKKLRGKTYNMSSSIPLIARLKLKICSLVLISAPITFISSFKPMLKALSLS